MRRKLSCAAGCLVLLFLSLSRHAGIKADDWPSWAGLRHDGISQETGFADSWPEEGLPIEWTREIGTGFSSISVVGDRLFTMGHREGKEKVWCLNSISGEVLWTHEYPSELIPNLHEGGPCATPTVDGDRVYTLGKEGQLFCLNVADGKVLWECMLQQELGVELPEWGFSSSAVILRDQLILEAGRVVSFDKINGKKQWQTEPHTAGYGSAAAFDRDGKTLLTTLDCDGLRVVDSADGNEIAFAAWKSPYRTNATTPIVVNDQIFVSTGYQVGCGLFRLQGDELKLVYKNTDMKNHFNNSTLLNGSLYGFDGDAHRGRNVTLNCIAFDTGELAWKQRGPACGSLLIVDGKLLILAENGTLILAEASPKEFIELARSPFSEGRCWTMPTLANGRVHWRNADGKLVCSKLPRLDRP
ncbi:MAG TPA: PQQ-binding-like beta-propeller repeat protein [Planctomycetaceae bacterium]|nr:PQQ-binding-like beta-propeller repeat protein [Planctomycetaceae bacterium]